MPPENQGPKATPENGIASNTSENKWDVMIAGFVGGVLAVLMRQIREFFTAGHVVSKIEGEVWAFVIGFGVLGALLVRIFREPNAGKAFVFGIALPSFLINLGSGVQNDPQQKPGNSQPKPATEFQENGGFGLFSIFSSSAYAQEPAAAGASWSVPGRTLQIVTVDESFAYHAELLDANDRKIKDIDVAANRSTPYTMAAPPEAAAIRFGSADKVIVKRFANKTPGITIGVALRVKYERSVGVAELLGKNPETLPVYTADVYEWKKAPAGLKGWVLLGNHNDSGWGLQTVDTGARIPKAGDEVKIIVPVNVRVAARSKQQPKGIISIGQHVRLLGDPQGPGALWAEVEVLPAASP